MAATTGITSTITNEALAAFKARVGETRKRAYEEWELADAKILRSQIRSWSVINGDMRPLYMDPDHAAKSPWGALIAPPAVILSYEQFNPETDAIQGTFNILSSAKVEWDGPLKMGDTLLPESVITSVEEITKDPSEGRVVSQVVTTEIRNLDGRLVGKAVLDWHFFERGSGAQRALFGDREDAYMWSQEQIEALGAEYKEEEQRGADTLYWDDVKEGEELDHVLKGPTTRTKYVGRSGSVWYWGMKLGFESMEQRPELFFENENSSLEPIMAVDWVHHRSQRWGGLPGSLEENTDHVHYLVQALVNWSGDAGFPHSMDLQFPIQNMVGDVTRSYGRVTGKRKEGDKAIVTFEVWQENELDERITTGTAEMVLPTR